MKQDLILAAGPLLLFALTAAAADIEVNTIFPDALDPFPADDMCDTDVLTPGLQCTLRAAVMTANAMPGADTIHLPPGAIIVLDRVGEGGAEVGDLNLTDDVTVLGFAGDPPGAPSALPLIDASPLNHRIFSVAGGVEATLRGLRLQGGSHDSGGAIHSFGVLSVEHSILSHNESDVGGAIYSVGPNASLTIADSHFERNTGTSFAAALSVTNGEAMITRSSFRDNRASTGIGSTIFLSETPVRFYMEDSTLDGGALAPPIAGLSADIGIAAFNPSDLRIRNSTVDNFAVSSLFVNHAAVGTRARVANSILAGGTESCHVAGADMNQADIVIHESLVQNQDGCSAFFSNVIQGISPDLGDFSSDAGRVTWSRSPSGAFSNVVDRGVDPDGLPVPADLACTSSDQRGNPRPQDGNGDDRAVCDMGAVEEGPPLVFVVDHFDEDLEDDVPGNGLCDITTMTGGATCTLRAAVMEANALSGLQRIHFAPGAHTAQLDRPFPVDGDLDITDSVFIEGNLQSGRPVTGIEQTVAGERVFDIDVPGGEPVILRNLVVTGGDSVPQSGGAVRVTGNSNVRITRSELAGNASSSAGGAVAVEAGVLVLTETDVHANQAGEFGAGLYVGSSGSAVVAGTSFRDNVDGGLAADGVLDTLHVRPGGVLRMFNSTVAGNSGGLQAVEANEIDLDHVTIANNLQMGLHAWFGAAHETLAINASIIAGHGTADCQLLNLPFVNTMELDYVLSSDGSCILGSPTSFSAHPQLLSPVRPPGRISYILPPLYGPDVAVPSPILDVAPADSCIPVDQHGRSRPQALPDVADVDGPCDLGAYEVVHHEFLFTDGFDDGP